MMKNKYSLDNINSAGTYTTSYGGDHLFAPQLIQSFLSSTDKILNSGDIIGRLIKSTDELYSLIAEYGGRIITKNKEQHYYQFKDNSLISLSFNDKMDYSITYKILDPFLLKMIEVIKDEFITTVTKKLIFTIVSSASGPAIQSMGDGSISLIEENYSPNVISDINYVVTSFKKTIPNGRICILNGEPGTGKTYLIRSILSELDCVFLIVPSSLIASLDKPDFIPLLAKIKSDYNKPVIMIIEDGDICLVPRKSDNMSVIASLLNLSDGIIGSLIDIRMIITTNAYIKDIDQAIMRPGRLCKNINVGPLCYEQSNKVYQRLLNSTESKLDFNKSGYTLAEIYSLSMNKDNSFNEHKLNTMSRLIGFSTSNLEQDLTVNLSEKI